MAEWDNPYEKDGRIKKQNFRPATIEAYHEALRLKWIAKDQGTNICYIYSVLAQSWVAAQDEVKKKNQAHIGGNVINLQMNNQFNYMPQVPRREPLNITKKGISGTIYRKVLESYILLKALEMPSTFSLLDFPELSPNVYKKAIQRLKRKKLIEAMEPRTNPRFYRLTPKFLIPLAKEHEYKISLYPLGFPTE